jgi:preprotein translocase subunit SecA
MFERLIADLNVEATRRVLNVEVEVMKDLPGVKQDLPAGRQEASAPHVHVHEPQKELVYKSASTIDPYAAKPKEKAPPPPRTLRSLSGLGKKSKVTVSQTTPEEQEMTTDKSQIMDAMGIKVTAPGTTKRKLGRNDPCWCGSGKKYKKCHLEADEKS